MRKIFVFMMTSLDGFIEGEDHDLSWHHVDEEFNHFAVKQMQEADTILFGRKTYELMEGFWPSKVGLEEDPLVANLMNSMPKVVVSKTLENVHETDIWQHVQLVRNTVVDEIKALKDQSGKDIIVLGSNNLCVTLLVNNLLDEIRIMVNPVVIGKGTQLFQGIHKKIGFELVKTRSFQNGNILMTYNAKQ